MTLRTLIRSPLLHFFVLGGCIFAAFSAIDDTPTAPEPDVITLSSDEARRLVDQFRKTWSRTPDSSELEGLIQAWVLEEALVREAMALGLDQGDPVIRQRLSLKMKFLAEGTAMAQQADEATLQAFLDANPGVFRKSEEFAFSQLLLTPKQADDAREIRAALQSGADPAEFASPSLLPADMAMTRAAGIDRIFGDGFSDKLADLPEGRWEGPVKSGYGLHLVRVVGHAEGVQPPLSEVRDRVEAEWRAAKARESRQAFNEALLERYFVTLPLAEDVLAR